MGLIQAHLKTAYGKYERHAASCRDAASWASGGVEMEDVKNMNLGRDSRGNHWPRGGCGLLYASMAVVSS
jgi:hypothetical protein